MIPHTIHRIHLIKHNCMKSQDVTLACLESAKDTLDRVLVREPAFFQDPQNPQNPKKMHVSHQSFNMIKPTFELPGVTIYVTNHHTFVRYTEQKDLIDSPYQWPSK